MTYCTCCALCTSHHITSEQRERIMVDKAVASSTLARIRIRNGRRRGQNSLCGLRGALGAGDGGCGGSGSDRALVRLWVAQRRRHLVRARIGLLLLLLPGACSCIGSGSGSGCSFGERRLVAASLASVAKARVLEAIGARAGSVMARRLYQAEALRQRHLLEGLAQTTPHRHVFFAAYTQRLR